jgi:hypothetical protein
MNYLIYTPYRCGSSFVTRLIQKNLDERSVTFMDELDFNTPSNNLLIKGHDVDVSILDNIKIDYIFTSIRNPTEIFISAFFKNIKDKDYPYYYNKKINRKNLPDMIDFFLSIPWHEYNWLCYDFNFNQIEKLTGINLWKEDFPKNLGFNKITKNDYTLIIVTHKTLNYNYDQFKDFIKTDLLFNNLDMSRFSYRNRDEFKNLYTEFIDKIPASFYEKYQNIDNKIKEKFL